MPGGISSCDLIEPSEVVKYSSINVDLWFMVFQVAKSEAKMRGVIHIKLDIC